MCWVFLRMMVAFPTRLASSGRTGFEVALGKHKPPARYLKLAADDIMRFGLTDISFSPARFDEEGTSIITSTGKLAIIWDLKSVKKGRLHYTVRVAGSDIKDLTAQDESRVVIAYPEDVDVFGKAGKVLV
eukprot:Polyplicarium_translucidae@DN2038_c0_g1_i1.p2